MTIGKSMLFRGTGKYLKKLKAFLTGNPLFVVLLPLFFVLHGYNENFLLIDRKDIFLLSLIYCGAAIVTCNTFLFFYQDRKKASLITFCLLFFFLFFGAIQDFLKIHFHLASRYKFLLGSFFLLVLIALVYLKKTKHSFTGLILFLNSLFCIYILIDLAGIGMKVIHPAVNPFSVYHPSEKAIPSIEATTEKPDIFFLIFDEYAGSYSLKQHYGFCNPLDTFLVKRGFSIQNKATSNYHYTWVSLASTLNMSYISGLPYNKILTVDDINYCLGLIRKNEVVRYLSAQGYVIANFSGFDLEGNPSPVPQVFLPARTRLITDNTLFSRIYRDLGGIFNNVNLLSDKMFYSISESNQLLLNMTGELSAVRRKQPVFVYAHFFMPHYPFFFDRNGHLRKKKDIIEDVKGKNQNPMSYLGNLQYTNIQIENLVDAIQRNTAGKAVIILMGDHGFREKMEENIHQNFQPLNAVFLPNKNYCQLYDSISSVNQFRVVFNTLFHQSLPLLQDSAVFLRRLNSTDSNK